MKKDNKEFKNYINLSIEIDTEKRVVCISDCDKTSDGCVARRYKTQKDIMRIINNYFFKEISLYPYKRSKKR